jgi:membrane protein YqaA with SNARE-associated domain
LPIPVQFSLWIFTWRWLRRLGGLGLIPLGIADNSLVPLPGSMDILTIWLAAGQRAWWPYYAAMATLGAVIGGYLTYGLAREGGRETLQKRLPGKKIEKVYRTFERWGFGAVVVPALLPPPFPIVPFLLAAGAMQYPRRKFLGALALGRGVRFTLLAVLGALYGTHIVHFFGQYYRPALLTLIGLAILGAMIALFKYFRFRQTHKKKSGKSTRGGKAA